MKSRKYTIKKIEGSRKMLIDSSIISNNEKYLVFNNENVIQIYDIK